MPTNKQTLIVLLALVLAVSLDSLAWGENLSTKNIETRGQIALRDDVVEELAVTGNQLDDLKEAYTDYHDLKRSLGRRLPQDYTDDDLEKLRGFAIEYWKRQDQILSAKQAKRLDQLLIQYTWLVDYEGTYRRTIGITFEEQKELDKTAGELATEVKEKMEQARRDYEAAMAEILTPRQMKQWREARGELFNFRVRGPHLQTFIMLR